MVWSRVRRFFGTLGLVEPRREGIACADSLVDVESWSEFALEMPDGYWERLHRARVASGRDAAIAKHGETELVMLCQALSMAAFLAEDGRVLVCDEKPIEVTRSEAYKLVVAAFLVSGRSEFLEVLPSRPDDAATCSLCDGTRTYRPFAETAWGSELTYACERCSGLGWTARDVAGAAASDASDDLDAADEAALNAALVVAATEVENGRCRPAADVLADLRGRGSAS